MTDDDTYVQYPIREVLGKIDAKLDGIDAKLDSKASASVVRELAADVAKITERVTILEVGERHEHAARDSNGTTKERVWNVALSIALILVTLIGVLGVHL